MTCPACNGENQGRGCPACLDCTRRVVGLPPLEELDDQPITTPDAAAWSCVWQVVFLFIAFLCGTASFIHFFLR